MAMPPDKLADGDAALSPERVDAFVRLLGQNQRRIFLYVMSLVPNWNDAEEIIQGLAAPWTYIATGQAFDDEMRERIAEHRRRRGDGWHTIEAPLDLSGALAEAADTPVLVDCLTLWLSNLMLSEHDVAAAVAGR